MTAYSRSGEVNLEEIYVSKWGSHVLAHTNPGGVGITTQSDEWIKCLQDTLNETDGVYNAGIKL